MKQVQILGKSGDGYNTSDGFKRAIGNTEHRVGSFPWCDGDYLLGGQEYSCYVPYVPQGSDGILFACPGMEMIGGDNPYRFYSAFEVLSKKIVKEYRGEKSFIDYSALPSKFMTDSADNNYLLFTDTGSRKYTIHNFNNRKNSYEKEGFFQDGLIGKNGDLYWFHGSKSAPDRITYTADLIKNGEVIKTFADGISNCGRARGIIEDFLHGSNVSVTYFSEYQARLTLLKNQIPQQWLDAGLPKGYRLYGTYGGADNLKSLGIFENTTTVYKLPPGNGWSLIATYCLPGEIEYDVPKMVIDPTFYYADNSGDNTCTFGKDCDQYTILKTMGSTCGAYLNISIGSTPAVDIKLADGKQIQKYLGSANDTNAELEDNVGNKLGAITSVDRLVITSNNALFTNSVDTSAYTAKNSFVMVGMGIDRKFMSEYDHNSKNGDFDYTFNKYGYRVQDGNVYWGDDLICADNAAYESGVVSHDNTNVYYTEMYDVVIDGMETMGCRIAAVNRNDGALDYYPMPSIPISGRWVKSKKATTTAKLLTK